MDFNLNPYLLWIFYGFQSESVWIMDFLCILNPWWIVNFLWNGYEFEKSVILDTQRTVELIFRQIFTFKFLLCKLIGTLNTF